MDTKNVDLWKDLSKKMREAAVIAENLNVNDKEQTYELQKEIVENVIKYAHFSAILSSYLSVHPESEH
ncbi:MAG: hypothetical protein IK117_04965 [Bacteroidales bacterium]|nr:hypothetical protein [Bacteroidales bacterium]